MLDEQAPFDIWTIGHSTRTLEEFLALLESNRIKAVADVRRHPGSRKYPHFNRDELAKALSDGGIEYAAFLELGGRRRPRPDSRNTAWRNASFRAYADYMETEEFRKGIDRLSELARSKRTAVMCAEAVWWRCHRGLIADDLKIRGVCVQHIMDGRKTEEHPFTSAARIVDGKLCYSPAG